MIALLLLLGLGQDWTAVVPPLAAKTLRVEVLTADGAVTCSGVLLDATRGFVLTAGHCIERPPQSAISITVNHRHAEIVRENHLLDLAILHTDIKNEQPMTLAAVTPPAGSEIALVGFAFGDRQLAVQFGHVALPRDDNQQLVLDIMVIPGQSGGAAVNRAGELVGLVQATRFAGAGASHLTLTAPVEVVRDFVRDYLPTTLK